MPRLTERMQESPGFPQRKTELQMTAEVHRKWMESALSEVCESGLWWRSSCFQCEPSLYLQNTENLHRVKAALVMI